MNKPLDWYIGKEYIHKDGDSTIKVLKQIAYTKNERYILWIEQIEFYLNGKWHACTPHGNQGNIHPARLDKEYILLTKASRLLYGK